MSRALLVLVLAAAGAVAALQPLVNARLAQRVGGVLESAAVSFAVGTAALLAVLALTGRLEGLAGAGDARWWELTGGLMGAAYVSATILVFPRVGTAAAVAAVIAAQLTAGLVLDHLGAFGFRQIGADWRRLAGAVLLVAGALLLYRR
ncbi:MAG: DMT family transporter [Deferrisomatales bacterium]